MMYLKIIKMIVVIAWKTVNITKKKQLGERFISRIV